MEEITPCNYQQPKIAKTNVNGEYSFCDYRTDGISSDEIYHEANKSIRADFIGPYLRASNISKIELND